MVEVLRTEDSKISVVTGWIEEEKTFTVMFIYPDGKVVRVEDFNNILILVETHTFWCAYTGIISTTIRSGQVEKHLTASNLRAS